MTDARTLLTPSNPDYVKHVWKTFPLLDPSLPFLAEKTLKKAMRQRDRRFPTQPLHFLFFPDDLPSAINQFFGEAIDRGIDAINQLVANSVPEHANVLTLDNIMNVEPGQTSFDIFSFVEHAFQRKEEAYHGKRVIDPVKRLSAYKRVRAIELGYRILRIDQCPQVLQSVLYFQALNRRLEHLLDISTEEDMDDPHFPRRFKTAAGVYVYGSKPFRSRLKYMSGEASKLKYSSILLKMIKDMTPPENIRDQVGAELIFEDDEAISTFMQYIRKETRLLGTLEAFKKTERRTDSNQESSALFRVTKFILRIPVETEFPHQIYPERRMYQLLPLELQLLTKKDALARDQEPAATHAEYKKRQFLKIVPALYPLEVYEHLL